MRKTILRMFVAALLHGSSIGATFAQAAPRK
jgi:hypothetical protein